MNHRADSVEGFETAGPFETRSQAVVFTAKYERKDQEPTRMILRYKGSCTPRSTERGASMVEYALLIVLIALIAFVAVRVAGENVSTAFSTVADGFTTN